MCKVLYESWSKLAKNKRPTCFLVTMQSFMVTSCFSILVLFKLMKSASGNPNQDSFVRAGVVKAAVIERTTTDVMAVFHYAETV